jgi:hypothetical protein
MNGIPPSICPTGFYRPPASPSAPIDARPLPRRGGAASAGVFKRLAGMARRAGAALLRRSRRGEVDPTCRS